ncbi:4'-phosphopantetheinyl transferase superfamily protein [uncultured Rummeliibacillus sp.]|uniref:4'-phosphopantetheinyl transferase family protein n=1 Tax=uncultured Rummeliibacillus sp. TaxID=762292 RepID=UPI00260704DE|nr:4'-phosphopantetheinyl transferase superfamily protein [uncultured Rummeliibacillus sp.]
MNWIYFNINELKDEQYQSFLKYVSKEKQFRLDQYRFIEDSKRSLLADLLVRIELIKNLQCSNNDLRFSKNNYGKPICLNKNSLYFNVSHSGDYVVAAFSKQPIGIDIEKHKNMNYLKFESILNRQEFEEIGKSDQPLKMFYRFWTAKESYVKAIGTGLAMKSLKEINILSNGSIEQSQILTPYHISHYVGDHYTVSICMKNEHKYKKGKSVSIEYLKTFLEENIR